MLEISGMLQMNKKLTLLGLSELLNESKRLSLQAALKSPSSTSVEVAQELLVAKIEELLKLETTEGELLELSLLAKGGNCLEINFVVSHCCYLSCE